MIELSKCPQCAIDNRVVIAGKEFCMRCGTPSEDNTLVESNAAASTNSDSASTSQSSVIAKFNNTPPTTAPIQQPATPAASDSPVATVSPPPVPVAEAIASIPGFSNDAATQLDSQISSLRATPLVPAEAIGSPAELSTSVAPISSPTEPITAPTASAATESPAIVTPAIEVALPIAAALVQASQPLQPEVAAGTVANQDPITQQSNPSSVYQPIQHSQLASNMFDSSLSHEAMQLNGHGGVLSDDQFDQLQNSHAPGPLPVNDRSTYSSYTPTPASTVSEASLQPIAVPSQSNNKYSGPVPAGRLAFDPAAIGHTSAKLPEISKQMAPIKKTFKPAGVAVSIVVLFMAGAYIWKLNYPNLAFKIASAKAGIVATVPGYMPSGFDLNGEIQTNPGSISYSLQNSQDNKKILISQSRTDWDSQALAENYVAPKAENYLALQAQGLTIYILAKNQATWVNHGTWYKIESSDQSLDQDQIIRMATSL